VQFANIAWQWTLEIEIADAAIPHPGFHLPE
jgi:hypothetical protein